MSIRMIFKYPLASGQGVGYRNAVQVDYPPGKIIAFDHDADGIPCIWVDHPDVAADKEPHMFLLMATGWAFPDPCPPVDYVGTIINPMAGAVDHLYRLP